MSSISPVFVGSLLFSLNLSISVLHNGSIAIVDCKAVYLECGSFLQAMLEIQLDWLI